MDDIIKYKRTTYLKRNFTFEKAKAENPSITKEEYNKLMGIKEVKKSKKD